MIEDKLTNAERIRLEALARVQGMASITPDNINQILDIAEKVEKCLIKAKENYQ